MQQKISKHAFSLIELSIVILIIGILIAGVTQSSRLIAQMRLASARALTQSSPISSIKDLSFWLEATSEASFDVADQEDNLPVDNWYDINPQTTSKINFSQGTGASQPLYKTNGINGLPSLQFDGSNDGFTQTNAALTMQEISGIDQITIFMVYKMNTVQDTNVFLISKNSDSSVRVNSHFPGVGNSVYYFDFGTCCVEGAGRYTGGSFPASYFNRVNIVVWHKKPSTAIIRVNGSQMISTALSGSFSGADLGSAITFYLGWFGSSTNYRLGGLMSEAIIFKRALKADEITDVENYLSRKWGVKIN